MLRVQKFIERFPEDGNKPARKPLCLHPGYTHDYFDAAFVCQENDPKLVRAHMLARDNLRDDDNVQFLDTFHDQRRAFVFQSNPLGIQADALYSEQTGYDFFL